MIQLGKRLSKKGLTVSLIIASNIHREPYTSEDYSITVHTIHDGFFPHEHPHAKIKDPPRFNDSTARSLTDFISRYKVFSFFWQILKVCLLFFNWSTTSLKSPKLMVTWKSMRHTRCVKHITRHTAYHLSSSSSLPSTHNHVQSFFTFSSNFANVLWIYYKYKLNKTLLIYYNYFLLIN